MSVHIQGGQLRALLLGVRVEKDAAALVQNDAVDLFTVSGGLVVVTSLTGVVTTAVGANVISVNLRHTPSGGSAAALNAATAVTSDPVGTFWGLTTGIAADLMSEQSPAGSEAPNPTFVHQLHQGIILGAGTIDLLSTNADPDGGAARWVLTYIPLDDGAAVAAA